MNVLIVDSTEEGDENFNEPLIKAFSKLASVTVKKLTDIKRTKDVEGYGALVIAGVPINYPYELAIVVHKVVRYGLKLDIPMLGICLGHEGIGTFFGSNLITAREKVDGIHKVNTKPESPLFRGLPPGFSTREIHEASITVPRDFKLIASSNKCRNMAMKHKREPIYGVQFHPEFFPKHPKIFSNFVHIADLHNTKKH